jgi:cellulose synthase/poly-beta-1,6-N-acetylglucosamine synthase-like glycosyltransferase
MIQEYSLLFLKFAALYFFGINILYGVLMLLSWIKVRKYNDEFNKSDKSSELPAVSFIIPAFNEESLIVETIQTYLSLPQGKKEIIVINDGSHDQTFRLLQTMFQLRRTYTDSNIFHSITQPDLIVLEDSHRGKANALNLGIKHARFELVCTMDADTIPTAEGVEASLRAFSRDSNLIATGGIIQVLNSKILKENSPLKERSLGLLTSFQSIEYLRTFLCVRLGWSLLGSTALISGAFCMIKKSAWSKVGGFRPESITEDLDLIIRLRKAYPGKTNQFRILPVVTCHTQVPKDKKHLMVQRMRWQMGLVETLSRNLDLCFNPKYGILGLLAIPYFWLVEVLSPFLEFTALTIIPVALMNGWITPFMVVLYFGAGLFYNLLITLFGAYLDNKHVSAHKNWFWTKTAIQAVMLHFGYKQLTSWWRLLANVRSFSKRYDWGEKPRQEIIHQTL